jgi:hypothetical protein
MPIPDEVLHFVLETAQQVVDNWFKNIPHAINSHLIIKGFYEGVR